MTTPAHDSSEWPGASGAPGRAGGPPLPAGSGDDAAPLSGGQPPHGGGSEPPSSDAPPPRRRRRPWKALAWLIAVPVLLVALLAGLLYGALTTERGTAYAWRAAVKLLDGRLAGTLDGGALATGVRLRDVAWRGADGTRVTVDRISGQWALGRQPWRFVVAYLHVGDVDLRIVPSTEPSSPATLPTDLQLPLAVEIRDLQVARLTLHQGASTSEYSRLMFHARSDGRHHEATVERLDTPFGAVSADAKLDGVRPFALKGNLGYSGKVSGEDVQVNGRVGGSLEALSADLEANGMKLTGRAHVEATPFEAVPLERVTLAFDHVNPQAFAPGAPFADLAVRADLAPVGAAAVSSAAAAGAAGSAVTAGVVKAASAGVASGRSGASGAMGVAGASKPVAALAPELAASAPPGASGPSTASASAYASAPSAGGASPAAPTPHAPASRGAAGFTVAGSVSIVNAKPGSLDDQLLPLIDARADVTLDAKTQRIGNLNVRVVKNATVTGGGTISGRNGQFDLNVAALDLNAIQSSVRATQLSGPVGIRLAGDVQSVTLDLADAKAGLRAQGKVTLDPARTTFSDVRVTSGAGRIDLAGAIKHDANSTYNLKATLTNFDPLSLTSQRPASAARRGDGRPATGAAAVQRSRNSANSNSAPSRATAERDALDPKRNLALNPARNPALNPAQDDARHPQPTRASPAPASPRPAASGHAPARRGVSASRPVEAHVNGTLTAAGVFAPAFTTKADFRLGPSVYDGLPLTGSGTVQLAGARLLPSRANLSVAGNEVDLQGSFGARGDRLRFRIDAPQLDRLGFGLAGQVAASGDLTGTFAHPDVALDYRADNVAFGSNRVGHAQGHAELRDGANGALVFTTDARDASVGGIDVTTLTARLSGTRAKHTFVASATGKVQGQALDVSVAANGRLSDTREGTRWDGVVTQLQNRGAPDIALQTPLTVSAGPGKVTLGATRIGLEGATLDLRAFDLDHGRLRSAGSLSGVSLARLMQLRQQITGVASTMRTDLVFDGDWDFSVGPTATGYVQVKRRAGDITTQIGRGMASLGIADLNARAQFSGGNRLTLTAHALANRVGVLDVDAYTQLTPRDGVLAFADDAPIGGTVRADVPSLATTGGLFGPSYLLAGHLALQLTLGGTLARPDLSGALTGDGLSATMVDQGVQLKDGVIHVALSHNLVDFQQVEFHGASGTLRATGRVRLDNDEPDLTASIVADKLELFASPDRKLSLSGSATVANAGRAGGLQIDGKFAVDRALFDLPDQPAPSLGDDVVVVMPDGTTRGGIPVETPGANRPVGRFAPRANVDIDLGRNFRFRGQGADLGLAGTITVMSAPNLPLRAVGNVRVTEGSTYTAFGRKLGIENGFFTFNGPVSNPGINILAMRRNQQVEAGVQVTGTVQAPVARLVSEPNVPDNEKLSWLLFGHGTDQGNNLGQQSAMTTALALLGSASGKRIAQTIGLDEFSIGRSEVGLTDPQVVMISKAINERLVIGYEQGLQSAANAVKATLNLTRYWSVAVYGGTFSGVDLLYTRRFDRFWSRGRSQADDR
ncbi:translocation and assembly module TamB [Paraburkholderia caballeronis]|uniref:translocation/assembly module TamB domain-containing protein n=1 Tax=Paraburkholderia caballeronis TaxID=416943 RepID=UPI0010670BF4|nr:translocation/assembly module TamB domain-containing protein [Paraburkholderia caballeronis]TDV34637.1 translocation and assembly module TamB [Paraburkholderia caballeronis]